MRALCAALVLTLLAGCSFHHAPYIAYEGDVPLSKTAVFVVYDQDSPYFTLMGIKTTDGKEMSCYQAGCPIWVRVPAGTHKFVLDLKGNYRMGGGGISYSQSAPEVTIKDMKARHVYKAKYQFVDGRMTVTATDLGENPDFYVDLKPHGRFRAGFDEKKP